ncbi:Heat-stable enterotoxin receptor [Liparis tanakae]|uniref:Heat-stable enterotoxin receptor n=1 Tax=Liparis tanakae TaxID=230148 RepID=A0A4Z2GCU2_9TELE|nr:Heat-stable enterotoxin receptor [Liparis tanakae]
MSWVLFPGRLKVFIHGWIRTSDSRLIWDLGNQGEAYMTRLQRLKINTAMRRGQVSRHRGEETTQRRGPRDEDSGTRTLGQGLWDEDSGTLGLWDSGTFTDVWIGSWRLFRRLTHVRAEHGPRPAGVGVGVGVVVGVVCLHGITINVVLLEDGESPWSLRFVKDKILEAIETDSTINTGEGTGFNLTAKFGGIRPTFYRHSGCQNSALSTNKENSSRSVVFPLQEEGSLGCAVLGPTCTYATFQMFDLEKGLKLSTPIMSAGSFGLSCDYTLNLQRLLPPARKIDEFFVKFWEDQNLIKPDWKTAYVYKKQRTVLRKPGDLKLVLSAPKNRTSNLFIMCGSPLDVAEVKSWCKEADGSDILFVLIDLFNDQYYTNRTSMPSMRNVLVLTMPNTRKYTINTDLENNTMNDYMAAYHDAVLLIGEVMRELAKRPASEIQQMEFVNVNHFRNISFNDPTSYNAIVIVLSVTVVVVATIAFIFYRQNKRHRQYRKRWFHISTDLVTLLENNQHNVISLKIENKIRKIQILRALYDRKLKQIDYYNLTKFYGTVKIDRAVYGVFEYCERGSLRYVLSDMVSYPEETFMDWEFKISVMYDIAKI